MKEPKKIVSTTFDFKTYKKLVKAAKLIDKSVSKFISELITKSVVNDENK